MNSEIVIKDTCILDDYVVLTADRIRVTVNRTKRGTHRAVDITYSAPINTELKIALPRWKGVGEQPDNTILLSDLNDIIFNKLEEQESAIERAEQDEIGSSEF